MDHSVAHKITVSVRDLKYTLVTFRLMLKKPDFYLTRKGIYLTDMMIDAKKLEKSFYEIRHFFDSYDVWETVERNAKSFTRSLRKRTGFILRITVTLR